MRNHPQQIQTNQISTGALPGLYRDARNTKNASLPGLYRGSAGEHLFVVDFSDKITVLTNVAELFLAKKLILANFIDPSHLLG
jgi:hypothetical protein